MTVEIRAVEMTRRIRDQNYQQTRGMTHSERIAFYRERAAEMRTRTPLPAAKPAGNPIRVSG